MDDNAKSTLQALFDADKERKTQAIVKLEDDKRLEELFLAEFKSVRDEVIRPEMEKMAEFIKLQGWSAKVVSEEEATDSKGGLSQASIRMMVAKDDKNQFNHNWFENAFFRVICDKRFGKINFHENTIMRGSGGTAGGTGSVIPKYITAELIAEKLTAYVSKLIKPFG